MAARCGAGVGVISGLQAEGFYCGSVDGLQAVHEIIGMQVACLFRIEVSGRVARQQATCGWLPLSQGVKTLKRRREGLLRVERRQNAQRGECE